jgi:hypothetical protein
MTRSHFSRSMTAAWITSLTVAGAVFASAADAEAWAPPAGWKAPRTADGHPDLQGNWNNATITPFEREQKYGERKNLSPQEADDIEHAEAKFNSTADAPTDPKTRVEDLPASCGRGFVGANCGYNNFWVDPGTRVIRLDDGARTSIVVDPMNGRVPAFTAAAQAKGASRMAELRARQSGSGGNGGPADGPEMRSLGERCILSFGSSAGPPMLPLLYNNNYQIVQTADSVMILVEMVHDLRVIRLNSKHQPSNVRQWMGDTIGHWEGDTLVAETTNFKPQQGFRGATENRKVVERFTRIGPDKIRYRFTIEDTDTYVQPWSGEVALNKTNDNIYEYACHEGNYALPGILAGAREAEREAAAGGGKAPAKPETKQ